MSKTLKDLILKYGIVGLAIVIIAIHFFFVKTESLSKWKGGGYGMYTEIHFYYHQVYIPGLSIDSLITERTDIKNAVRDLKIMPNDNNLKIVAELVLKTIKRDSIQVQFWKPTINSKDGTYSRVLFNEIRLKKSDL